MEQEQEQEQELIEDIELQQLMLNAFDAKEIYNEKLELLCKHLLTSIFYCSAEKYVRNEKAFKDEIKKLLNNRDANKLNAFSNEKYQRTDEHRDAKKEIKKINKSINQLWLDCGHRMFDDEFDTMNRRLNPGRFDKKTPKTASSNEETPSSNNKIIPSRSITPILMDNLDDTTEEMDEMDNITEEIRKKIANITISSSPSGNLVNFFDIIPDELKMVEKKNPHKMKHHFDNPLILLITGQAGSGKSSFLANCISRFNPDNGEKTYDHIWFIRPEGSPDEALTAMLKIKYGMEIFDGINSIPNIPTDNSSGTYLVIFDDMLGVRDKNNIIQNFFKMGRKTCSIIFLTQSYFDTPKFYRNNMYYLALLPPLLQKDISSVMATVGGDLSSADLQRIFHLGTSQKPKPLIIDIKKPLESRFRRGFDNECIPVPPPTIVPTFAPTIPNQLDDDDISVLTSEDTKSGGNNYKKSGNNNHKSDTKIKTLEQTSVTNSSTKEKTTIECNSTTTTSADFDKHSLITIVQENQIYFKQKFGNEVFKLVSVGSYDEITNTIDFFNEENLC